MSRDAAATRRDGGWRVSAVVAVHVVIAISLMAATTILSVIKDAGVTLLARIAGLLLAAIAVQMLVDAIKAFTAQ